MYWCWFLQYEKGSFKKYDIFNLTEGLQGMYTLKRKERTTLMMAELPPLMNEAKRQTEKKETNFPIRSKLPMNVVDRGINLQQEAAFQMLSINDTHCHKFHWETCPWFEGVGMQPSSLQGRTRPHVGELVGKKKADNTQSLEVDRTDFIYPQDSWTG